MGRDKMIAEDMSKKLNITIEQATKILDNFCIFCNTPVSEDLRKWFGKGGQGGAGGGGWDRFSSTGKRIGKCGDSKKGGAQKKGGDPLKGGERKKGQKTIKVKTGA